MVIADKSLDGSSKAQLLSFPSEREIALQEQPVRVEAIHYARRAVLSQLAQALQSDLETCYHNNQVSGPYRNDATSINKRRIANTCLGLLSFIDNADIHQLVWQQFTNAGDMTTSEAALAAIIHSNHPNRQEAVSRFFSTWSNEPLVIDKWFSLQASASYDGAFNDIEALSKHQAFSITNPNRARSLLGPFGANNISLFHRADGAGYTFLADHVLELDQLNPQVAARMVSLFNQWKRFDQQRQTLQQEQLKRILASEPSTDVYEIVSRALKAS